MRKLVPHPVKDQYRKGSEEKKETRHAWTERRRKEERLRLVRLALEMGEK